MRRIGSLQDAVAAQRFCDYLVTLSIDAVAEDDGESLWDIWVRDESHVQQARDEMAAFQASPDAEKYKVAKAANRIREERVAIEQRRRKNHQNYSQKMASRGPAGGMLGGLPLRQQNIPVTVAIIAISVVCSLLTSFGEPKGGSAPGTYTLGQQAFLNFSFVDPVDYVKSDRDSFASIRKGHFWRLLTPMFLHGSMMHLAFNMMGVFFLGSAIERLQGSFFFAVLVVLTHVFGMMLQVSLPGAESLPMGLEKLAGSPFAIGASGAVYGVFGYIWVRPMLDPSFPLRMTTSNVYLVLGWMVACIFVIDGIANGAHVGGLLAGMAIAYVVVHFLHPSQR